MSDVYLPPNLLRSATVCTIDAVSGRFDLTSLAELGVAETFPT